MRRIKNTGNTLLVVALIIAAGAVFAHFNAVEEYLPVDKLSGENPLYTVVSISLVLILACFAAGSISGDYSWVDRLWSLVPVWYAWIYAAYADFTRPVLLAALLVTLWGARLTFNFARRGGYTDFEDYRWPILRSRIKPRALWQLFNLGFISFYQQSLFILFTLPVYVIARRFVVAEQPELELPLLFVISAIALLVFLFFETVADNQQWSFQNAKYSADTKQDRRADKENGSQGGLDEDIRRGFLTRGLFRYSRHPNYFGELGVWWMVYLLGVGATGELFHWSAAGVILLTILFIGSTGFTESITASKYPQYEEYQRSTSMIIPLPPKGRAFSTENY